MNEQQSEQSYKREPILERNFNNVKKEDQRIALLATLLTAEKTASTLIISDGEKKVTCISPSDELFERIEVGKHYRFIGIPLFFEEGFELRLELVQEMNDVSKNLYTKTFNKLLWQ